MDATRLATLTVTGNDPREWGRQHGEAFAREIRQLADIRRGLLSKHLPGWSNVKLDALCDDQLAVMKDRWPRILAEVEGIGEASGVSLRDLVILNAYTDLKDFGDSVPEEGGCSLIAAKGPTVNFSGQTWDMHASAEPFTLLLTLPDGTRVLTLMGCLALSGVNSTGVCVLINDLQCRETDRRGLIWPGLVRLVLEQRSAAAGTKTLAANLPSSGHNYLIADTTEAVDIETTGRQSDTIVTLSLPTTRGYIGHTNHYLGGLVKQERREKISPTTRTRQTAVLKFFESHPIDSMTGELLFHEFFEKGPLCDGVTQRGTDPAASRTCAGFAVDHAAKKAYAWRGIYDRNKRIEWTW